MCFTFRTVRFLFVFLWRWKCELTGKKCCKVRGNFASKVIWRDLNSPKANVLTYFHGVTIRLGQGWGIVWLSSWLIDCFMSVKEKKTYINLRNTNVVSGKHLLLICYMICLLANLLNFFVLSVHAYPCLCVWMFSLNPGLRDWYWKHLREKSIEEETAVQNFPLVPGQHLPWDEDVQRHHRIWSCKLSFPSQL